ncbi:major capsid protein [Methylobrevis pamukkalensis]|uniref:Phage major capsid protein E n=1 Tax=Methylobrevis pamukkalensis TaxID=1439726 RepID=A0A1E3H1P6_9HYPH|nr:major capsid protein [Methylobrevis pamukkalensis]ODN70214.1 hypothetical protein A6302_02488 [Methylobrevis pamukkalensis]
MATMDVFKNDVFSAVSLTAAVDKIGYVPGFLSSLPGLYVPTPVRTTDVFIEERSNAPALIQTSPRGAPPKQKARELRTARSFQTLRLAQSSTIQSSEIQNIRAFGSETELEQVQVEVARRLSLMRADMELTRENMLLGMVQGVVTDADGTPLYNWATEFQQTIPAELDFDLDNAAPASGVVRKKCNEVVRSITRGLKGMGGNAVRIVGLCGDAFWDDLTAHSEVRETFLNTQMAASLREGNAFEQFTFGGITFVNYRGTDDGSTVAIGTDKCKFFPLNAGIFPMAFAPAEPFDFANTLGREFYSWMVYDRDRNMWVQPEMYSYPLPVCVMPQALHRAKRT